MFNKTCILYKYIYTYKNFILCAVYVIFYIYIYIYIYIYYSVIYNFIMIILV